MNVYVREFFLKIDLDEKEKKEMSLNIQIE